MVFILFLIEVNKKDNGSSRSINSNSNNNKEKYSINAKKILVTSIVLVFLLSSTVLTQNQTILLLSSQQQQQQQHQQEQSPSLSITSLAYAEKIKIKNKSLINDISDKVVKNNDGNDNDELQSILQQIQTQISLIAGSDKATNALKQIRSVIELNANGPLAQSLLFLAKQQAAGNIEGVNKVTTDVARYAATGDTDGIFFVLAQAVGGGGAEGSSLSAPNQQRLQQIQPSSQPLAYTSTTTFFSNNSNSDNIDEPSSLSPPAQLPQITTPPLTPSSSPQLPWLTSSPSSSSSSSSTATGLSLSQSLLPYDNPGQQQQQQQIQQPQAPEQQQQLLSQSSVSSAPEQLQQSVNHHQNAALISPLTSSPSLYPTTDLSNHNNRINGTDTNTVASNSSPHSTIRVTSIDQQTNHPHPTLYSPMSNSTQPQETQQRAQLEQRIQEVINELNSSNRSDAASLPTFIQKY